MIVIVVTSLQERERERVPVSFPTNYTADKSNWI